MTIKKLKSFLLRNGWILVSHNRHLKFKYKNGKVLITSSSPRCLHGHKHAMQDALKIMKEVSDDKEKKTENLSRDLLRA